MKPLLTFLITSNKALQKDLWKPKLGRFSIWRKQESASIRRLRAVKCSSWRTWGKSSTSRHNQGLPWVSLSLSTLSRGNMTTVKIGEIFWGWLPLQQCYSRSLVPARATSLEQTVMATNSSLWTHLSSTTSAPTHSSLEVAMEQHLVREATWEVLSSRELSTLPSLVRACLILLHSITSNYSNIATPLGLPSSTIPLSSCLQWVSSIVPCSSSLNMITAASSTTYSLVLPLIPLSCNPTRPTTPPLI